MWLIVKHDDGSHLAQIDGNFTGRTASRKRKEREKSQYRRENNGPVLAQKQVFLLKASKWWRCWHNSRGFARRCGPFSVCRVGILARSEQRPTSLECHLPPSFPNAASASTLFLMVAVLRENFTPALTLRERPAQIFF